MNLLLIWLNCDLFSKKSCGQQVRDGIRWITSQMQVRLMTDTILVKHFEKEKR